MRVLVVTPSKGPSETKSFLWQRAHEQGLVVRFPFLQNKSCSFLKILAFFFPSHLQPLTNGFADDGDWSESSEEDHQGRYSPLVAMAMSGTNTKPPTGISPPRAQSPFNKASTPLNTTGGALGTSLNGSFALQGKKRILK